MVNIQVITTNENWPEKFREDLEKACGDDINIFICGNGGKFNDGFLFGQALAYYPGKYTINIVLPSRF